MNSKLLSPVSVSGQASSLLQMLKKPLTSPMSFARIQGLLLPSGLLFEDPALIKCTPHKPIFFPFPSHHPCSQPIVIKEKGRECRRQEASLNAFANPFYSCRKHFIQPLLCGYTFASFASLFSQPSPALLWVWWSICPYQCHSSWAPLLSTIAYSKIYMWGQLLLKCSKKDNPQGSLAIPSTQSRAPEAVQNGNRLA